jgi:hypothetical protein
MYSESEPEIDIHASIQMREKEFYGDDHQEEESVELKRNLSTKMSSKQIVLV